jgi:hypothetical protein
MIGLDDVPGFTISWDGAIALYREEKVWKQ